MKKNIKKVVKKKNLNKKFTRKLRLEEQPLLQPKLIHKKNIGFNNEYVNVRNCPVSLAIKKFGVRAKKFQKRKQKTKRKKMQKKNFVFDLSIIFLN